MTPPPGWQNLITASPGQVQTAVDPMQLLPSRFDLLRPRLEFQRALLLSKQARTTPIRVSRDGVIWDGHHAVRAAAEEGILVDVVVVAHPVPAAGPLILDLPVG